MASVSFIALGGALLFLAPAPPGPRELAGRPCWLSLGGDVSRADGRFEAERQVLAFEAGARWFLGFPRPATREEYDAWLKRRGVHQVQEPERPGETQYQIPGGPTFPRSATDLPLRDQGATLRLAVEPAAGRDDAPATLQFRLTLASNGRAIRREVEHRRTNALPFLFALYADGKPVDPAGAGGVGDGGARSFVELVPEGGQREWRLRVSAKSLDALLPPGTRELAIVPAFAERQHVPGGERAAADAGAGEMWNLKDVRPQVLVRGEAVRLVRVAGAWRPARR